MNTLDFTHAKKNFTEFVARCLSLLFTLTVIVSLTEAVQASWEVDFSRRLKTTRDQDLNVAESADSGDGEGRSPASVMVDQIDEATVKPSGDAKPSHVKNRKTTSLLDSVLEVGEPVQDVVILNTDKGFVPNTVQVRKDGRYKIHIVNVNESERNVSFILDGFAENHSTYFGKEKSFIVEPKKEGIFLFQSPETGKEGRLVVVSPVVPVTAPPAAITVRSPASLGKP